MKELNQIQDQSPPNMPDTKKVLIVAGTFYPTISPRALRATELAKELSRKGHEVVVYIPDEGIDYSDFIEKHPMQIRSLGRLKYREIKIKGGRIQTFFRRFIRRAVGMLFEYPNIEFMFKVSGKLRKESGYDTLISIAVPYPIHWGVAKIRSPRRRIAKTWVADCGDPFMGNTADTFKRLFYFKYVEIWSFRKADFIAVPVEEAKSGYYAEFHEKIKVIPQGFNLSNLDLTEYRKLYDYPIFAYAGSLFPGQHDPRPLLKFLSESNLDFRFIVYTRQRHLLEPFFDVLGEKLVVNDYIPREELLKVLSGVDFLVNFSYIEGTQLPHKLIDYAITDRPVLNIPAEPDFRVLLEFMDGNYENRLKLTPASHYDIDGVAEKFIRLESQN